MTESQQLSEVPEGAKSCYNVELDCWERKGGKGAFLQMESAGQVNNSYIYEDSIGQEFKSPTPAVWRQRAGAPPAVRAFGSKKYQL